LASELDDIADDIVTDGQDVGSGTGQIGVVTAQVGTVPATMAVASMRSEPTGKLFIERRS